MAMKGAENVKYTNPIPIWLSTTMRQIKGQYSDGHGGRCAMGVLYVPKHTAEGASAASRSSFGILGSSNILEMNDQKEGMSFRQIAEEVAAHPEVYFLPGAVAQFKREDALAKEFEQVAETVLVTETVT